MHDHTTGPLTGPHPMTPTGRALWVCLGPAGHPGRWTDNTTGARGNLLELIARQRGDATRAPRTHPLSRGARRRSRTQIPRGLATDQELMKSMRAERNLAWPSKHPIARTQHGATRVGLRELRPSGGLTTPVPRSGHPSEQSRAGYCAAPTPGQAAAPGPRPSTCRSRERSRKKSRYRARHPRHAGIGKPRRPTLQPIVARIAFGFHPSRGTGACHRGDDRSPRIHGAR